VNNLDIRKYTSTYMVGAPVAPWIVNPDVVDRLQLNAAFIAHHKKKYSKKLDTWHIRSYMKSLKEFNQSERAGLEHYGIKTNQYLEGGKVNPEEFEKLFTTADLALSSERFFAPDFMCQGSSRHALLFDVQLKGVGTNHLNFSQDFHHRWGGFLTRDALRAIFNNEIINARTPLGASEILGLFIYQEKTFNHISECIQVRDAQSYRLAQLYPGCTLPEDRKVAQAFLDKKFNGASSKQILEKILNHYIVSFQNGVQYRSISYDNLLLDGVFTDAESVDFTVDKSQAPQFIKIFIPKKFEVKKETLAWYMQQFDCFLYSSWLHDLRLMYDMTAYVYDEVYKKKHYDDELFVKMVTPLMKDFPKGNLLDFDSYRETILLPHRQRDLHQLTAVEMAPYADYNVIDFYENIELEGMVVTFCKGREFDLRLETVQQLNRLEVLLHSEYEKLNLDKSFENFEILKKSVSKYI
jgi:hypothetical protein